MIIYVSRRCKSHHDEGHRCETCDRVALELPYHLTALQDNARLLTVLTNENVFDRLNRPESQAQLFTMLKTCGGGAYNLAVKTYTHALLTSWLDCYLPSDDRVSVLCDVCIVR